MLERQRALQEKKKEEKPQKTKEELA